MDAPHKGPILIRKAHPCHDVFTMHVLFKYYGVNLADEKHYSFGAVIAGLFIFMEYSSVAMLHVFKMKTYSTIIIEHNFVQMLIFLLPFILWDKLHFQDVCDLMTVSNDSVRMTRSSQEAYPPILCASGDVIFQLMHLLLVTKYIISHQTARRWYNLFGPYLSKQIQIHPSHGHHSYPNSIRNCRKANGNICLLHMIFAKIDFTWSS